MLMPPDQNLKDYIDAQPTVEAAREAVLAAAEKLFRNRHPSNLDWLFYEVQKMLDARADALRAEGWPGDTFEPKSITPARG